MARTPLVRIAYVQFGPGGKSYLTRCHRRDIGAGQAVTVLMRAGTPGEYLMDGFVTDIGFQRWSCRSHTLYRADEAPGFLLADDVPPSSSTPAQVQRAAHAAREARADMEELYDALDIGDGHPVYLSDGVCLTSAGKLFECR